jgi:hypothetical protein
MLETTTSLLLAGVSPRPEDGSPRAKSVGSTEHPRVVYAPG